MDKIYDLATVLVDNAFRLHPIDEERYELFLSALDVIISSHKAQGGKRHTHEWSAAAKEWSLAVHESLSGSIMSALRLYQFSSGLVEADCTIAYDRFARLKASFDRCGLRATFLADLESGDTSDMLLSAWTCVLMTMRTTPGFLVMRNGEAINYCFTLST